MVGQFSPVTFSWKVEFNLILKGIKEHSLFLIRDWKGRRSADIPKIYSDKNLSKILRNCRYDRLWQRHFLLSFFFTNLEG